MANLATQFVEECPVRKFVQGLIQSYEFSVTKLARLIPPKTVGITQTVLLYIEFSRRAGTKLEMNMTDH